ncbi:uncharacterized protein LOC128951922 [Oppia nitens]|uniref:uncharacterized protein LOC128951922 n=1 Tax=Oppia nitens TaxID=1686743 RepID=UPI0023DC365D|nr:uncharacterized protein LOC128951922 [Oppia nitens]
MASNLMDFYIHNDIYSHPYHVNPVIGDYFIGQTGRFHQNNPEMFIVRQSPILPPTDISWLPPQLLQQPGNNVHQYCIVPIPAIAYDQIKCWICYGVVVNGFRCTTEAESFGQTADPLVVPHFVCYKCITGYMMCHQSRIVDCPVDNCINQFNLDNLVYMDAIHTQMTAQLFMYCECNCGMGGNPLALANHICPLAPDDDIGHTYRSTELQRLRQHNQFYVNQIQLMEGELRDLIRNYDTKRYEYHELIVENTAIRQIHSRLQSLMADILSELRDEYRQLMDSKELVENELRHVLHSYNVKRQAYHDLQQQNRWLIQYNWTVIQQNTHFNRQISQLELQVLSLQEQLDRMNLV